MKLKKLLKDIPAEDIKGSKEVEITGVCSNSNLVAPGNLFVARKGLTTNGAQFIPQAIESGAVAVLTDIYDPTLRNVTQIIHPDVASLEGSIAAAYNLHPSDELLLVGITGTNGKTTTAYLIKSLLDYLDEGPCGLIGTIEYIIGSQRYQATHTTPEVCTNQKMLREMLVQGCHSAVMEVTSHALDQGRVNNIDFDVALFTNLTLDHLDYHQTMEQYAKAKNKLFRNLDPNRKKKKRRTVKSAIVNVDSPWHQAIAEGCQADFITYGIENQADLTASDIEMTSTETKLNLHYQGKMIPCRWSFIGRYNLYNCLSAIAVALSQEKTLEEVANAMQFIPPVPGRLEPVPNNQGYKIYVDFAHSDDALLNVFSCLKELKKGKLITVFGCGGDRDRSKRPKMAEVCEKYSDMSFVTTDNPRKEDPIGIIRDIIQGFKSLDSYMIESDRREAISKAIDMATPNDIILIAGKGHEQYQIFAHQTIEFDDRIVAKELVEELEAKV